MSPLRKRSFLQARVLPMTNSQDTHIPTKRVIGYARVSTEEQNPELQIEALKEAGCNFIYCDHGLSGMKRQRPELEQALGSLNHGDKLKVWKLDRLARSISHLIDILDDLGKRGVEFESLTEKIDTDTAYGEFVFHILAGFAQMERRIISERTKAGLAAAKKRGKRLGRPPVLDRKHTEDVFQQMKASGKTKSEMARQLNISYSSISRAFRRYGFSEANPD